MTRTSLLVLATAAVAIVAIGVAALSGKPDAPSAPTNQAPATSAPVRIPAQAVAPSVAPMAAVASPAAARAAATAAPSADPIGTVRPVPATANAQVALVLSSLQTHDHPERLSAMIQPPAFVPGSDSVAYAAEVAPGRSFQSAQPGPGVPVLGPVGPTQLTMDQDGRVFLRARSLPGGVVTFTSFDLGQFGNSLATQTVVADQNGVASVAFKAGPGTIDAVHVLAGSPQASGQVAYHIVVTPAIAHSAH